VTCARLGLTANNSAVIAIPDNAFILVSTCHEVLSRPCPKS
jgi:hypothetical protein